MTALSDLLYRFRHTAVTEREKGNYFERLVKVFLLHEPFYADLYGERVWLWEEWRAEAGKRGLGDVGPDAGIDLVAETATGDLHAIQAKFYDEDARLRLDDLATFFTASSKKQYAQRLVFLTATRGTANLRRAIADQNPPVSLVTFTDLEASQIDWAQYQPDRTPVLKPKKTLRPHQVTAVDSVVSGLKNAKRGKLIMACGTGKTFTSLKIAEKIAGAGGRVLFLVPSLALLSQALTEWTQESRTPLHSFAVCSDADVGKKAVDGDFRMLSHELQYPATTDAPRLAAAVQRRADGRHMTVVFSTYHSLQVVADAQRLAGMKDALGEAPGSLPDFDLIICDESHRTTGATFEGEDESTFVRIHDPDYIHGARRLYMTATPRIYGNLAKASAERDHVTLASMDDEAVFGRELHVITFSEAVKRGLLVDYKVIVLAIEESHISRRIQSLLKDPSNQLRIDDAAKIVGCWKALAKQDLQEELTTDAAPMQRAVAFCQVIEPSHGKKIAKVSSKEIAAMFQAVVEAYQATAEDEEATELVCEVEHVDGSMSAGEKDAKLKWLKAKAPERTCRILSNVRCLSEGVDVPALDAVLFLTPRNSQVDVVQSVGRVMRNAPGKTRGYVVLPVVIPAGMEPHEALNDNAVYKVVWQVLQALRSHDDRFDAMVNKLELVGPDRAKMEVIAITDKIPRKPAKAERTGLSNKRAGRGGHSIGTPEMPIPDQPTQYEMQYKIGEIERAIYAKMVQKVGNRHHWEDWAGDIAKIARTHIDRIQAILEDPANTRERKAFNAFAGELRDDLNDALTDAEIVEMLAQHLITQPVFEALFSGYSFAAHNPVSRAMQHVLSVLQEHRLDKETDTLQSFYDSVKLRAEGIESAAAKQKIIVELYDKFFRTAFPKMSERLGIVYTPVEVVDFILNSVQDVLKTEFGASLGDEGVHILDPFTGTGTFITRLLQSGLIPKDRLPYKYQHEIHANELVLLAYYIAAINIESVYHDLIGGAYRPFEGICLTDTFQMTEKADLVDAILVQNSARRKRQMTLDIRVIVGNPPYSVGQGNENDNAKNVSYPHLDRRIAETYVARSDAMLSKSLYDSYIRAIRWASDRIGDSGVIGFVTNAGWIKANTADGLRKCLVEEFSDLWVFHLRGHQRTLGERSRIEGGKVFASGSRAPIAITLLVKNPHASEHGRIHFHDIGDYLSREDKLQTIKDFVSVSGITAADGWQALTPDAHGDWLDQRNDSFGRFIVLGDKKDDGLKLFDNYSQGVLTARDAWCYDASREAVTANMTRMIAFYNGEVQRFDTAHAGLDAKARKAAVDACIDTDATKISWTRSLKAELAKDRTFEFEPTCVVRSLYRPFTKQWMYFNRRFNEMVYQIPRIFPEAGAENRVICITGLGETAAFSSLISDVVPNFHFIAGSQCFPLYLYDDAEPEGADSVGKEDDLFGPDTAKPAESHGHRTRRDAITDEGLAHFQSAYPGETITKEDVFYYVYGLLHSPDYRERYANNLSKELPRIPRVKTAAAFLAFSQAGRALADLHLHYETVAMYAGARIEHGKTPLTDADYRVTKMKVPKVKGVKDLTRLIYNGRITVAGIPPEAYEYVVNGKPALEWVIERQCVKTDKASGIVNDANAWAAETMHNPKYPLELFLRVITVSLETLQIVKRLPKLEIEDV